MALLRNVVSMPAINVEIVASERREMSYQDIQAAIELDCIHQNGPPTGIVSSHFSEDTKMPGKRERPEGTVLKLWQVEVLQG